MASTENAPEISGQVYGGWILPYAIAWFLSGIGGSIYYTYSRPYLMDRLGGGSYYVVGLLIAAEQIPALLAIPAGFLVDLFGRRNLLLLGFISSSLYMSLALVDPSMFPVVVGVITGVGTMSGLAGAGIVLTASRRSGRTYSFLAMLAALGWVVGGVVPGLFRDYIGSLGVFSLVSILYTVSMAIQYIYAPVRGEVGEKPALRELPVVFRNTWDLALSSTLALTGLTMFYNIVSLRIYSELGKNLLVYGLALSTSTALANALVRPLAGVLVDRYNPVMIIVYSLIGYLFLDTGIYVASGLTRLILWIIPVYPFRDTALVISLSKRVPLKLQATIAGLNSTTASISGLTILAINEIIRGDLWLTYTTHITLLITAIIILTITNYKQRSKPINSDTFIP